MGGLPTPRPPAEIVNNHVIDINGKDVSEQFAKGAAEVLQLALSAGVTHAILKERSPSCGVHFIYDGSHSGKIIPGQGITTRLLMMNNIKIISEEEL
jgi:uncharacterized protein YbbK (DUF523 family)